MKIKLLVLPILFTLLTLPVFAVGKPDNPGNINSQEKRGLAQARLDEAKLKSCQARENSIMKRAESLGNLVENSHGLFRSILVLFLALCFRQSCRPASLNRCFTHFIGPAQKPSLRQAITGWAQK